MKKLISIVLCLAMLFSFTSVAFAADESDLPVIYLAGRNNTDIYKSDGTVAFNPATLNRTEYILNATKPVLTELGKALISGDYSAYVDSLVDATAPIYEDIKLDSDGNADGTYIAWDYKTVAIDKNASTFDFKYDWRLSPIEVADQLDAFIERVLEVTGKDGVNIHCRCLGVNFAMTYVKKSYDGDYAHPFRVRNIMLNTSALAGYITLGALMSGSVEIDPDVADRFVTDYLSDSDMFDDPALAMFAYSLVSILNYADVLDLGVDFVQNIIDDILDELVPKLALCCYGGYTSYWSMVSDEYYDKAKAAVFNTDELKEEYKVFIEKIDAYHALMSDINPDTNKPLYEEFLTKLKSEGVGIAVVAKYGKICMPLFEDSEITGDARGTVIEMSFGANATDVGKTFSEDYINNAIANGTDKYISPDKTVDASTALFPETTWFVKNVGHSEFPNYFNDLFKEFCRSGGTMTVFDNEAYPQYLNKVNGSVIADEDDGDTSSKWTNNPIKLLFRLLTGLVAFFQKLFNRSK